MSDFGRYWHDLDRELAEIVPALELEAIPRMSSDAATVYRAAFTSIGPYRLGGFLSVPRGRGPFPGLLATPRYGSVNQPPHPLDQDRYQVLVLMHRGQRLADVPMRAAYPGLLTLDVADPERYVFRGIAADCLRAFEVLAARPEIDRERIAATGGDLAFIVAARRTVPYTAVTEPFLFHRLPDAMVRTDLYPTEEFHDHLRAHPGDDAAVRRTTALFDPERHASDVRGRVLLPVGDDGQIGGREWVAGLIDVLGDRVDVLQLSHRGGRDQDAVDAWLSRSLAVPARPRSWTVAR